MVEEGEKFKIPVVKAYSFGDDIENALKEIEKTKGIEGFVLRFEDDRMFKIKSIWYRELHDSFNSQAIGNEKLKENGIIKLIIDQEIDDTVAALNTTEMKEKLENYTDLFWECVNERTKEIEAFVKKAQEDKLTRRDLYEKTKTNFSTEQIVILRTFEGKDCFKTLCEQIKKETEKKFPDELRKWLQGNKKLELHQSFSFVSYKKKLNEEDD